MKDKLSRDIGSLLETYGADVVRHELERLTENVNAEQICTILINEGLHHFPDHLFVGKRFVFYKGGLDFSSEQALEADIVNRLIQLKIFLGTQKWKRIYTIISGHAAVCMQVKLAVYRITHLETIDWAFDGAGNYRKIELPLRQILLQGEDC